MKKLGILLSVSGIFLLASCGKSAKDEFLDYMEAQSQQTQGTWEFKMGIDDLTLAESSEASNPMVNMLATQVKDMSLAGTVKSNTKEDNAFAMDMTFNGFGMSIPLNMVGKVGDEPKIYLATDMMEYLVSIVNSMAGTNTAEQVDMTAFKGKYIDLLSTDQETLKAFNEGFESGQKESAELSKKQMEFFKKLDKKSFTKNKNVLSHTFTKEEFIELIKLTDQETDTATITEAFKEFQELSAQVDIDTKTDKVTVKMTMKPEANSEAAASFTSIGLTLETTLKDKKADIKMPKESDILTNEEVQTLFPTEAIAESTGLGDTTISDEDFKEVKAAFEENKDQIDEATAQEILTAYKDVLTDAQYKEIEDLFKE